MAITAPGSGGPTVGPIDITGPIGPNIPTPGVGQLTVIAGNVSVGAIAPDPNLHNIMRAAGVDPLSLDRMSWPAGASRHASITVLLTGDQIDTLITESGTDPVRVAVMMETLLFDRMFLRPPKGIVPAEGSGVLHVCEIVDERFFWRSIFDDVNVGYNVHTDRKWKRIDDPNDPDQMITVPDLYESTMFLGQTPWTPRQIVDAAFDGGFNRVDELFIPNTFEELDDESAIRDLVAGDYSMAETVDRVLRQVGIVLVVHPNSEYDDGQAQSRYLARRAVEGLQDVEIELGRHGDLIVAGTLQGAPFGQANSPDPPSGPGSGPLAIGVGALLSSEVPLAVDVRFPTAPETPSGYGFNDESESDPEKTQWVAKDRYSSKPVTLAQLETAGFLVRVDRTNGLTLPVYDSMWAVRASDGTVINDAELTARALEVAFNYYSRFSSGVGEILFAGIVAVRPWAGAHVIEWSIDLAGASTRVRGTFDDPLFFGPSPGAALTPGAILSTGAVKATTRPDGGVTIDAPFVAGTRIHLGVITAVNGDPNATYDAESVDFPDTIKVEDQAPLRRPFAPGGISHPAAPVDTPCEIIEMPGGEFLLYSVALEFANVSLCPAPALSEGFRGTDLALVLSANGI